MTRPFFKIGAGHCVIKRFRSQRFKALIKGLPFLIKGRCTKSPDICHPQIISSGKNQPQRANGGRDSPFFTARKAPVIRRCTISLSPPLSMRDKYFPRRRTAVTTASLRPFLNLQAKGGQSCGAIRFSRLQFSVPIRTAPGRSVPVRLLEVPASFLLYLERKGAGSPTPSLLILRQPRSYRRQYQPQGAPSG